VLDRITISYCRYSGTVLLLRLCRGSTVECVVGVMQHNREEHLSVRAVVSVEIAFFALFRPWSG